MIPALSIRQPWAWAIVHAGKDIENRDWPTTYRGPFLVHAGKKVDGAAVNYLRDCGFAVPDTLPTGGIVGRAEITGCVRDHTSNWFQGTFGFVLTDARPVPFRPAVGRLYFFDPDSGRIVHR